MINSKKMVGVVLLAMSTIVWVVVYLVIPKLTGLYSEMGANLPNTTKLLIDYGSYISAGFLGLSLTMFFPNQLDDLNLPWQKITMILIGLMVGYLVIAVISPIYDLTSSF